MHERGAMLTMTSSRTLVSRLINVAYNLLAHNATSS